VAEMSYTIKGLNMRLIIYMNNFSGDYLLIESLKGKE
jgi:hypothetical protein